jgi:membrane protease subunit HflK
MPWGKDGKPQGPWGKPPGGGNLPPNGGGRGPKGPQPPDFDELIRRSQEKFARLFGGGLDPERDGKRGLVLFGAIAVVLWAASGVYLVKADEQGVVMRFGKFDRISTPGVGYHLPYPMESVLTPKVTAVNRVEVGFRSGYGSRNGKSVTPVPEESLMLTGDENIADVNFEVQWKIAEAEKFLFNVRNPEETVKAVSESAMREVMGKNEIATVLAEGKLQVANATKKLIQETLDAYGTGVEVVSVNLGDVNPPSQVIDAFRDVQSARADLETARNQAEAYRNDIIPRARGDAEKMILEAEAYKQEVVSKATGEASRFAAVYNEYKQSKDATKKRMYLEMLEEILPGMNKMIMQKNAGSGVVPYMALPELKPAAGPKVLEVKP